jgi:hypothetical protein
VKTLKPVKYADKKTLNYSPSPLARACVNGASIKESATLRRFLLDILYLDVEEGWELNRRGSFWPVLMTLIYWMKEEMS